MGNSCLQLWSVHLTLATTRSKEPVSGTELSTWRGVPPRGVTKGTWSLGSSVRVSCTSTTAARALSRSAGLSPCTTSPASDSLSVADSSARPDRDAHETCRY